MTHALFNEIAAKVAAKSAVRVIVTKGEYQTRYDIVRPHDGRILEDDEILAAAREAGAQGHMTLFPPFTVMADPIPA